MNNSKLNTVLLGVIIVLLAVGLYVLIGKKDSGPAIVDTSETSIVPSQTVPAYQQPVVQKPSVPATHNPSVITNPSTNPGWTTVMEESGMSVSIPKGYSYTTLVPNAMVGHGVALNVNYNNKNVVSLYKFSDQRYFNESHSTLNGYTLVTNNYTVGGLTGAYYKGDTGIGDMILLPSKFILISIEPLSFSGVSQVTLDTIINSIKL